VCDYKNSLIVLRYINFIIIKCDLETNNGIIILLYCVFRWSTLTCLGYTATPRVLLLVITIQIPIPTIDGIIYTYIYICII